MIVMILLFAQINYIKSKTTFCGACSAQLSRSSQPKLPLRLVR